MIGDRDGGRKRVLCCDGKQCLVLRLGERETVCVCVALMYNGEIVMV